MFIVIWQLLQLFEFVDLYLQILKLDHDISINRKHIASVCAKARNEYSKTQIKKDFKAGLKVISFFLN